MSGETAPKLPEDNGLDGFADRLTETFFTPKGEMIVAVDVKEGGEILTHFEHMADPDGQAGEKTFPSIQAYRDYLIAEGAEDLRPPETAEQTKADVVLDRPQPPGKPDEQKEAQDVILPPHKPIEIVTNDEQEKARKPTKIKVEVQQKGTAMPGEKPPKFDPLEEAKSNADEQKARYYTMVGDTSEFPDHATFAAANKDMADYLEARPFEDAKGNLHEPETNQFIKNPNKESEEEYYDRLATDSVESTDQFAGKSLNELAHMVAEARGRGDKTGAGDAEDVFSDRFVAMAQKYDWPDESVSARLDRFHEIMNGGASANQSTNAKSGESQPATAPDGGSGSPEGGADAGTAPAGSPEGAGGSGTPEQPAVDDQKESADGQASGEQPVSPEAKEEISDLNVILKNLKESDAYKNASPEERQAMEDEATNRWIAAEAAKAKKSETNTTAQPEADLNVILKNLKESDAYKNASPEERQAMEDEATNRWIAAEAAKAKKAEQNSSDSALDATLEKTIPGYKDMSEEDRKKIRDELRASGLLKDEAPKPEKPDEAAEKARKEKLDKIEEELRSTEAFKNYREALNKYAELKADSDTKGYLPFGIGKAKRERLMSEATTELVNAKKALAAEVAKRREQAGLYEGDEAHVKQSMSDDILDEIRKIDPETRDMTNKVLIERQKGRNTFQRVAIKFGRHLNGGDKALKRYARNAGYGFGVGALKGVAIGLLGSWPLGIALGAAGGGALMASRYGAKMAALDDTLKNHLGKDGEAVPRLNDEQFADLLKSTRESLPENARDIGKISDKLARDILQGSVDAGIKEKNEARNKARKNVGAMGLGWLAGGVGGFFAGQAVHDAWNAAHVAVNPADAHPNEGQLPNDRYPTPVEAPAPAHVDLGGARFPWNYAANQVGADNATAELRSRAAQAVARGHNVQWYRTVNGSSALRIDGSDKTQDVIDILWGNK